MCHNRANPGDDYVLRKSCVRTYWWLHDCRIAKIPADATPATELAGTIAIEGTVIAETERIVEAATAAAIALNDLAELNQPQ